MRGLRHLLAEALSAFADLDGRFWRSLRALLFHPGKLSSEYIEGRRRRWVGPLSLFVMINVLYFLVPPASDFDLSLQDQIQFQPWGQWAHQLVESRVEARGTDLETYTAQYAAKSGSIAKSLIVWHIPWIALVLMVWMARRSWYYAEHVVVAAHGFSFLLAIALILSWVIGPAVAWILRILEVSAGGMMQRVLITTLLITALAYWSVACRRVYGLGAWRTVLAGPVFFVGLVVAHFSYRFVQFVLTFWVT